jgi:hypothetical protein
VAGNLAGRRVYDEDPPSLLPEPVERFVPIEGDEVRS